MKVFQSIQEAEPVQDAAVCLGNFDGVHVGHQALLVEAGKWGPVGVLTFHPHPGKVLQPELAPKLITQLTRKLELLESLGVHFTIVQPFSLEYAKTTPAQFEEALFQTLGVRHVVVGYDFTYGVKRLGTFETLKAAGLRHPASVHRVNPVSIEGVVVSSSRIREYLLEGRVQAAYKLLGRYFDIDGTVVRGQGRGKTVGFPTANVDTANELRPAPGVYAVRMRFAHEPTWHKGVANIGVKPTFGGTEVTIEVHLLDLSRDLYGQQVRVQFIERLRSEMRFGSAAELASQIRRDVETARVELARADA